MLDGMIDDTIESDWTITDINERPQARSEAAVFSVSVLLGYWNAIAQN